MLDYSKGQYVFYSHYLIKKHNIILHYFSAHRTKLRLPHNFNRKTALVFLWEMEQSTVPGDLWLPKHINREGCCTQHTTHKPTVLFSLFCTVSPTTPGLLMRELMGHREEEMTSGVSDIRACLGAVWFANGLKRMQKGQEKNHV